MNLPIKLEGDALAKFQKMVAGTPMEAIAAQKGLIPSALDKACAAFKTRDEDTLRVIEQARKLADRQEPVLICGESGVGKELIARILHGLRSGPFVAVNTTAVTDGLFESELFGHGRGAFTGAVTERQGLIKEADGGTLFLDEIGDMPYNLQAKMLRVIQESKYRMVGCNHELPLTCRFISATHRSLDDMIEKGMFRLDLLERLSVFVLRVKPLRDRIDDIRDLDIPAELVDWTLEEHKLRKQSSHTFLRGNTRQLLNLSLRYSVLGPKSIVVPDFY